VIIRPPRAKPAPAPSFVPPEKPFSRAIGPPPPLTEEERHDVALFKAATPAVVFITSFAEARDLLTLDPLEVPAGAGSGFFWTPDKVVTNYHVVKDAKQLKVTLGDGTVVDARTVGFDEDKDVAVLSLSLPEGAARITPLPLGSSGALSVGQKVFAIGAKRGCDAYCLLLTGCCAGNPFGLDHSECPVLHMWWCGL
jgi:S1-C subfamily serine protease